MCFVSSVSACLCSFHLRFGCSKVVLQFQRPICNGQYSMSNISAALRKPESMGQIIVFSIYVFFLHTRRTYYLMFFVFFKCLLCCRLIQLTLLGLLDACFLFKAQLLQPSVVEFECDWSWTVLSSCEGENVIWCSAAVAVAASYRPSNDTGGLRSARHHLLCIYPGGNRVFFISGTSLSLASHHFCCWVKCDFRDSCCASSSCPESKKQLPPKN